MSLIEWNSNFELGVSDLDADHQRLVDFINQLDATLRDGVDNQSAFDTVDALVAHFEAHSKRENEILDRIGDPETSEHKAAHDSSLDTLREMRERMQSENAAEVVQAIVTFLVRWFNHHVVGQDMRMRPYLEAAGLAQGKRVGLLNALTGRFRVGSRIAVAVMIPLLAFAGAGGTLIQDKVSVLSEMSRLEQLGRLAPSVSALVHEMQKERGLSAGYM